MTPSDFNDRGLVKDGRFLGLRTVLMVLAIIAVLQASIFLTPTITFILLDSVLAIYLASAFSGRLKYLFLIHPGFLLFSSYGFQIPFSEIGVGFTYLNTFNMMVNPETLGVNDMAGDFYQNKETIFGFGKVYLGIIPIIWLPSFLFDDAPEIALYYSMGIFNLFYMALVVFISQTFKVLKSENLLIIVLYSTVSPTFFDVSTTLHRYGLLICGLSIFLISYLGLVKQNKSFASVIGLLITLLISLLMVGFSKPQLFYVLFLFVTLDLLSSNKLGLLSQIFRAMDKRLFLVILVLALQLFAKILIPEQHISEAINSGGQFTFLSDIPLLGFLLRVLYAVLSPFPWFGFSQWHLYGDNYMFLLVHIISAFTAAWLVLSLVMRFSAVFRSNYQDRAFLIYGLCLMLSLMFSGIGFHVYLAPALPFLAIILIKKSFRVSFVYPLSLCLIMEVVAQSARLI